MATMTSLGFSIFSRYDGSGVTRARRDLNDLNNTLDRTGSSMAFFNSRASAIGTAIAAFGPAVIPVGAALTAVAAGFTAVATAAGLAGGAWLGVTKGAITVTNQMGAHLKLANAQLAEQKQRLAELKPGTEAYKQQLLKVHQAQAKVNSLMGQLSQTQVEYIANTQELGDVWAAFLADTSPSTLGPLNTVMLTLIHHMYDLKPLITAVGKLAQGAADRFKLWADGGGIKRLVDLLVREGVPALGKFMTIIENVTKFLIKGFKDFLPTGDHVLDVLERGSAALRNWADNGGFQRFLAYVQQNGPKVHEFFQLLGEALRTLMAAMKQLGPLALTLTGTLLKLIVSLGPTGVADAVKAWLALQAAILGIRAVSTVVTVVKGISAALTFLATAAAAADLPLSAILIPLGLIGAVVIALGVDIYLLITRWNEFATYISSSFMDAVRGTWDFLKQLWSWISSFFAVVWQVVQQGWSTFATYISSSFMSAVRAVWDGLKTAWQWITSVFATVWDAVKTAWSAAWGALKAAADAVWGALKAAWQAVASFFVTTWNTVSSALKTAWTAAWNALSTAAKAVWSAIQTAWNAFLTAVRTIWNTVSSALHTAWTAFWNAISTAAKAVWSALQSAWNTFLTAIRTIWNTVSSALHTAWTAFWSAISTAARTVWSALQSAWNTFLTAVRTIWNTISSALHTAWNAFWNALKTAAQTVWSAMQTAWHTFTGSFKKVWDSVSGALKTAFSTVWDAIHRTASTVWGKITGVVRTAVNAIIGVINTIGGAINKVSSAVGLGNIIPHINPLGSGGGGGSNVAPQAAEGGQGQAFARGGVIPGFAPGKDTVPAMLSKGEGVLVPEAVRGLGGAGFIHWANHTFAGHRGAGKAGFPGYSDFSRQFGSMHFAKGGTVQGFAGGGLPDIKIPSPGDILGGIADVAKGVIGTITGGGIPGLVLGFIEDKVFDKLADFMMGILGKFDNPAGEFGKILVAAVKKIIDGVIDFLKKKNEEEKKKVEAMAVAGAQSVAAWAPLAKQAMILGGLNPAQLPKFLALMAAESGGNPNAINTTDINAKNGIPSQGLMQVIPPTFSAYHVAGTSNNILDPLANMAAAANYILHRYGGNVPGSPYATGTNSATPGVHLVGEHGPELAMFGGGEKVLSATQTAQAAKGGGGGGGSDVQKTMQDLTDAAKTMQDAVTQAWQQVTKKTNDSWASMSATDFVPMKTQMGTTIPTSLGEMKTAWNTNWNAMHSQLNAHWSGMRDQAFTPLNTEMNTTVPAAAVAMRADVVTQANAMKTQVGAASSAMRTQLTTDSTATKTLLSANSTALKAQLTADSNAMRATISANSTAVKTQVTGDAAAMTSGVTASWNQLQSATTSAWNNIKTTITNDTTAAVGPINKLIGGFNNVGKALGISTTVPTIALAKGGVVNMRKGGSLSGFAPGHDRIPAMLSPGEGVLTPEAVRGLGGSDFVNSANRHFAGHRGAGKGAPAFSRFAHNGMHRHNHKRNKGMQAQHFALGGMTLGEQQLPGGIPGDDGLMNFLIGTITAQDAAGLACAGVPQSMVTQGSFSTGVAASAGTHSGDGVVDLGTVDPAVLARMIACGWAAWIRTPSEGFPYHIHAVLMGASGLSPEAAAQVVSFLHGGTGLGVGAIDPASLASLGLGLGGLGAINAGDILKKVVGGDSSAVPAGMGQLILSMLTESDVTGAFSDLKSGIDNMKVGAGIYGQSLKAMGGKIYDGVIAKVMDEVEKAKAAMAAALAAAAAAGGGALVGGPVPPGMAPAVFTSFWDPNTPMANGQMMNDTAIASSYLPLGSSVTVAYGGKSVTSTIQDLGPAQFVYDRHPGVCVLDLAEPMMQFFTGVRSNVVNGSWKLNSLGSGRTLYGLSTRGFQNGTPGATAGWHLVGERGPEWVRFRGGEKVVPNGEVPRWNGHDARVVPNTAPRPSEEGLDHGVHFHEGAFQFEFKAPVSPDAIPAIKNDLVPALRMAVEAGCRKKGH